MASINEVLARIPTAISSDKPLVVNKGTDQEVLAQAAMHESRHEYKEAMQIYLKLTDEGNTDAPIFAVSMLKNGGEEAQRQAFEVCYAAA
jgi:hypothetical protein